MASSYTDVIAVMCESLFVGAFAALTLLVCYILITKYRSMSTTHKFLFGASIIMFFLSVAHLGLVIQQVTMDRIPGANYKIQIVISAFQFIIGDLILIWRVWIIWGCNHWIACGPLAIMVAAAGLTFNLASDGEIQTFFMKVPTALIVTNTSICTILIAGRIWHMCHQSRKLFGTDYSPGYKGVAILIIETGVLYALFQLATLILDHVGSNALPIMLDLEIPLIGILPTLIVVCVHFDIVPGTSARERYNPTLSSNSIGRWHVQTDTLSTTAAAMPGEDSGRKSKTVMSAPNEHELVPGNTGRTENTPVAV